MKINQQRRKTIRDSVHAEQGFCSSLFEGCIWARWSCQLCALDAVKCQMLGVHSDIQVHDFRQEAASIHHDKAGTPLHELVGLGGGD